MRCPMTSCPLFRLSVDSPARRSNVSPQTPPICIVQCIPQTRRRREHRVPVDRGGNRARDTAEGGALIAHLASISEIRGPTTMTSVFGPGGVLSASGPNFCSKPPGVHTSR
jgi:hypothetical protein